MRWSLTGQRTSAGSGASPRLLPTGTSGPEKMCLNARSRTRQARTRQPQQGKHTLVIVATSDWTVIPLENLVAQSDKIIALVKDEKDAQMALHVLEKGTHGILLKTDSPAMVKSVAALMKSPTGKVGLVPFKVTKIDPVGMGDRVCVDTCSMLSDGEGMLMGNTSSAMLLVHAETLENPYVAPRPFRVNAGAVHAYILLPDGKTAYLSDLAIGGQVLVVDGKGTAHTAIIGRTKIERRPLLLVEAKPERQRSASSSRTRRRYGWSADDGKAISVVNLQKGDTIMGCILEGGRHFGMAVKETIREK